MRERRFDEMTRAMPRRQTRRATIGGMIGGALAVIGADVARVAATPKDKDKNRVAFCHLDDATGAYSVIEVPAKAADAHIRHGDVPIADLDTASDSQHCGGCGITCPEGMTCVDGECVAISIPPEPQSFHGNLQAVEGGPVIILATCSAPINGAPYDSYTIDHPGGPISLELTGNELYDPTLILYAGTALPVHNMCEGRVAFDDDCGRGVNAYIERDLAAGTYTAVVTGYADEPFGFYTLELYGFSGGETSTFCPPPS